MNKQHLYGPCDWYWTCQNGSAVAERCHDKQMFDPVTSSCRELIKLAVPNKCDSFKECVDLSKGSEFAIWRETQCPFETRHFDFESQSCVNETESNCIIYGRENTEDFAAFTEQMSMAIDRGFEDLKKMSHKMDAFSDRVNLLFDRLANVSGQVDQRFDEISQRLNSSFERLETRIDKDTKRMDKIPDKSLIMVRAGKKLKIHEFWNREIIFRGINYF